MNSPAPTIPAPVLPQAPAAPPMFGQQTTPGSKPGKKPSQPTSILSSMMAPGFGSGGQKTLLGQ